MLVYHVFTFLVLGNSARGHLPVKQPAFRNLPTTIKSRENDTVFVPCLIDDLGGNPLKWWKEDVLLYDSESVQVETSPRMSVLTDGVVIDSVTADDAGNYTCEITRPRPWSPLRLTQELLVLYPPKVYPVPSSGYLEVVLGGKVEIGCSATGMPSPSIIWRTQNTSMTSFGENTEKLEFSASSRLLSGIYQCEANNGIGNPVHANFILRILHPPEVEVDKEKIHSAPGVKMTLECRVVAEPQSKVFWLFNGVVLKSSTPRILIQSRGFNNFLVFSPVSMSDFGNYTCRASNRLGTSERSIQLIGVANAGIIKATEIRPPDGFMLYWEVDSYSNIFEYKLSFRQEGSIHWNSVIVPADGFPSGPIHSKSYLLTGLDRSARYEAKILSRNRFGWSEPSEIIRFGFTKQEYEAEESVLDRLLPTSSAKTIIPETLTLSILIIKLFQSIYDSS